MAQDALNELTERGRARQVRAVACEVDPGQHHLPKTLADDIVHRVDHLPGGHRSAVPASIGYDTEGAAVIAAVLHFDEGPGMIGKGGGEVRSRFAHAHDVRHADSGVVATEQLRRIALFAVADHC